MFRNNSLALNNASNVPSDAVVNAEKKLERIEAYVCVVAILLAILVVFGSQRRRDSNVALKYCIWVAYVSCTYLIGYTIGLMQSASFHNELFAVWGAFLLTFFGSADCISAYSLEDNENWKRYNLEVLVQFFGLGWLIMKYKFKAIIGVPLYFLFCLSLIRTGEKAAALKSASKDELKRSTRPIADFMTNEHRLYNDDDVDASSMKGYNYLVGGENKNEALLYRKKSDIPSDVITIDKIWQCNGNLLNSGDTDGRLKDICLSFALYRILLCRFAGYSLFESPESKEKCRKFVRDGLIFKGGGHEEVNHERVFKVIEDELRFVYDSLYTKYPIIFARGRKLKSIQFISVIVVCWIMVYIIRDYQAPNGQLKLVTVGGHDVDILVTGIGIAIIIFVEFVQYLDFICSVWAKIRWVCSYVQNPSCHSNRWIEKFIQFFCRLKWLKPWERKLGQYSLLHSFNHNPCILLYNSWTSNYIDQYRKGQKQSKRIKLPVEVKKAVILRTNGLLLRNGEASRRRNGVWNKLSSAWGLESPTHIIMVLHIVTNLFEIQSESKGSEDFIVATTLSKYCAYLVAFAPRLVPHHADFPEVIFDKVVLEARHFLKECNSPKEIEEKILKLCKDDNREENISSGSIFGRVAIVANDLILTDNQQIWQKWKILADFWVDMMLFVTPSNDVNAHAEHLAMGGEFVTHLWALLTHAGILNQDSVQDVLSTQDASTHSQELSAQDVLSLVVQSPEIREFPTHSREFPA